MTQIYIINCILQKIQFFHQQIRRIKYSQPTMKLKVRLIKPKKKLISFYKTSQIQFKTITNLPTVNQKFRSTQKVIASQDPWTHLSQQQIQMLVDRLQDQPEMLYRVIQHRNALSKDKRCKFSKLDNQNCQIKEKLRQRIRMKRLSYEQQYKSLFRQKNRLVIMTDLPKIGKIKFVKEEHVNKLSLKPQATVINASRFR